MTMNDTLQSPGTSRLRAPTRRRAAIGAARRHGADPPVDVIEDSTGIRCTPICRASQDKLSLHVEADTPDDRRAR